LLRSLATIQPVTGRHYKRTKYKTSFKSHRI